MPISLLARSPWERGRPQTFAEALHALSLTPQLGIIRAADPVAAYLIPRALEHMTRVLQAVGVKDPSILTRFLARSPREVLVAAKPTFGEAGLYYPTLGQIHLSLDPTLWGPHAARQGTGYITPSGLLGHEFAHVAQDWVGRLTEPFPGIGMVRARPGLKPLAAKYYNQPIERLPSIFEPLGPGRIVDKEAFHRALAEWFGP